MKRCIYLFLIFLSFRAKSQSVFFIDQQSTNNFDAGANLVMQPTGQFFTPTMIGIDTVALKIYDGVDSSVYVKIRDGSFNGNEIGTSQIVTLSPTYHGITLFNFSSIVPLRPGFQYFIQALVASGGPVIWNESLGPYSGGQEIYGGRVFPRDTFWFQEGITIVPEPSALWLSVAGAGGMVFWRKRFGSRL
jgi:hypothetical protein